MKTKTIEKLSEMNGKVYVYLANDDIGNKFMQQAEAEGFTFGDGAQPTKRCYAEIMAINDDRTINFVGTIGRIAFGCDAKLIRVDFAKYLSGENDYIK